MARTIELVGANDNDFRGGHVRLFSSHLESPRVESACLFASSEAVDNYL